jgi:hypothetical protein
VLLREGVVRGGETRADGGKLELQPAEGLSLRRGEVLNNKAMKCRKERLHLRKVKYEEMSLQNEFRARN